MPQPSANQLPTRALTLSPPASPQQRPPSATMPSSSPPPSPPARALTPSPPASPQQRPPRDPLDAMSMWFCYQCARFVRPPRDPLNATCGWCFREHLYQKRACAKSHDLDHLAFCPNRGFSRYALSERGPSLVWVHRPMITKVHQSKSP